ncbi:MAG: restriction endonuclease subunit S [Bacteroidota bacterium]
MSRNLELPKHWEVKKLGEVCDIQTGKYDANHAKPSGKFRFYTCAYEYMFCDTNRFKGESLILPGNGANVGEVFYYNGDFDAYQRTYVLNGIKTLPKYLYYHLLGNWRRKNQDKQFGSATNYIRMANFTDYLVPIPPLPEQVAIVSKIEELLSDLDNGKQQLLTAQQQLKVYRQSLLKAAFEGKLTEDWRRLEVRLPSGAQKDKTKPKVLGSRVRIPSKSHTEELMAAEPEVEYVPKGSIPTFGTEPMKGVPEGRFELSQPQLPEGWKWEKLGEVIEKIEAGKSFKCDERKPQLNEVGVLKVSAVTWQVFDENESKTVIGKDRINKNYFVKKHDFLFSRANTLDLIGAVVLVNSIERKLMLSDKTLRFEFTSDVLKPYILYYLRSRKGRREIQRLSSGNQVSMRNIGQARIKEIEFPLPSLKEQQAIVEELESKLTVCDKIEETISNSLQQAETLKQSILKKAFEGRLV